MEFIRSIREKQITAKENQIHQMAEQLITVADFDNNLFIAYNGTPLVPINKESTSADIVDKLNLLRTNYINSKMKEKGLGVAVL